MAGMTGTNTRGDNVHRVDVVIVGGGIVGATMAALLCELPLRVALIDSGPWDKAPAPRLAATEFDPRVSALTEATRQCFAGLGVWGGISGRRACPYHEMHVWDADGTGSIHFDAADIDQDSLGTIAENAVIMAALREGLAAADNVEILAGQSVDELNPPTDDSDEGVGIGTDRGTRLQAALLIAADGANSPTRAMAGFRTREWDYGHEAIVTTVRTQRPHAQTAWQRFMATGPLAFLPLLPAPDSGDQHYCSIVWSTTPAEASRLTALADGEFCRELATAFERRLGEVEHAAPRFSFPLRQRHAVDYVRPGMALIGDAAHTIHPLAGQGVNLGILDAMALAAELRRGLAAGRLPGDSVPLRRYQRARSSHNLSMMWLMEGFKHLFAAEALPVRWLRNMGMSGVDNLGVIKNELARRAMGLG